MKLRKSLDGLLILAVMFLTCLVGAADAGCIGDDTGADYGCGDTLTESCTFNESMNCSSGAGLIIGANNITINGSGYTITGNKSACDCTEGMYPPLSSTSQAIPAKHSAILSDQDNVVIKNLKIKDFCDGIGLSRTDNNTVTGCSISNCGKNGVSTHGIHMGGTNNCTITKNEIFNTIGTGDGCGDGGNGIFMHGEIDAGGDWNNITYNNLSYNNKSGFFMKFTPMHNIISNNIATGNGEGGIVPMCKKSNYNIIERNNASGNAYYGIYIGGKNNTIRYNTVNNNGYYGINLDRSDGSYNNELYENTVCGNGVADIRTCGPECHGNHGDNNTCDTTYNYDDEGTTGCSYACEEVSIFDTGTGIYPSIFGTHNGTIIPDRDIMVNKMYTYPCEGTGGHTKYVKIWNESEGIEGIGNWSGYQGDYHNITISPTITLLKNYEYNYIIRTGSYPQIVHAREYKAKEGGNITCTEFRDANGRKYDDWIPAIRLYVE